MSNPNDTNGARVVGGFNALGRLGSIQRVEPKAGPITYSHKALMERAEDDEEVLEAWQSDDDENITLKEAKIDSGSSIKIARAYGLPKHIKGSPLGCGCSEAHLAGATKPVGSHIEADYMCDSGWHNYVVFELIGFEDKTESSIKVDANGNLIEDAKTEPQELGDF